MTLLKIMSLASFIAPSLQLEESDIVTVNGDDGFIYVMSFGDPDGTGDIDAGEATVNRIFHESENHILLRECLECTSADHEFIYYKRLTDTEDVDLHTLTWSWYSDDDSGHSNILGENFQLYSTLSDALTGINPWTYCNYAANVGMFRDCGAEGIVKNNWIRLDYDRDARIYIYVPEEYTTLSPTEYPTLSPTESLFDMKYINEMRCNDLTDNAVIEYGIKEAECVQKCQGYGASCRMINYFKFFKTTNDSRCYLYSAACSVKADTNNNNQSLIGYKVFSESCNNDPTDWVDAVGDSCDYYHTFNWCDDGQWLRNENEYYDLIDTKYGLSALETCCECDGGAHIVDNVALSYDHDWSDFEDDVLCSWFQSDLTLLSETGNVFRQWDNLILYDLCNSLNKLECEHLINTDFAADSYDYTLYICHDDERNGSERQFILDIVIEDWNHATYINMDWADIDDTYYSADITIVHTNHSKCVQQITVSEQNNHTYLYGVHPCYILDTTFIPTEDLIMTENDTRNNSMLIAVVVVLSSVLFISLGVIIALVVYISFYKNSNAHIHDDNNAPQIELNQDKYRTNHPLDGHDTEGIVQHNAFNKVDDPSAPALR